MPPYQFYLRQRQYHRKIERAWEQTRAIMAMQHNTAMGAKRQVRAAEIIPLSFDRWVEAPQWTKEEAEELIRLWPDIPKN
jgi:hypothetical protein